MSNIANRVKASNGSQPEDKAFQLHHQGEFQHYYFYVSVSAWRQSQQCSQSICSQNFHMPRLSDHKHYIVYLEQVINNQESNDHHNNFPVVSHCSY